MTARVLSGKEAAAAVEAEVAERVAALAARGKTVGLATILVGEDPASQVYVRGKHRAATRTGMRSFDHVLAAETPPAEVARLIDELNADPAVDAVLLQIPLPGGIDPLPFVERLDPGKDADGLHPVNLGRLLLGRPGLRPATPSGVLRLLDHYAVDTRGAFVVVVGRSFLVGRPLAVLLGLKGRDATVAVAHTATANLARLTRQADILVVAAGRQGLIGPEHVRPGAVVIDVGINRTPEGLAGDVDFAAVAEVAGAITPVPGGVGPMTIAGLLENTVAAAEAHAGR
ncbi:MAG: bifunctional 5,10-methylene-tetrahydrofolate dehydrogenase/5,10-methylene-tetrahydrofolate cyclohydrolase [Acidimicrobiia bacterium]|nr:bifunctional 5,10-methylene-tetrahydrofolate dehydrogenase/5,10-methylene-tetrahydrofolate cyclohydrolase [Acidimicrobiia bacterium]